MAITKFVETKMKSLGIKNPRDAIKIALDRKNKTKSRVSACFVLGQLNPPGSAQALLRLVRTEQNERIDWEAFSALGFIGDRRITKPLLKMLRNSTRRSRRQQIAYALWFLADARTKPVLIELLSNKKEDDAVRGYAAEGLGSLRPSLRSLEALASALEDASVNVRVSALCGLSLPACLLRLNPKQIKNRAARRFFIQEALPAVRARLHDRAAIKGEDTVASYASLVLSNWKGPKLA
jgi:hypothetical protein